MAGVALVYDIQGASAASQALQELARRSADLRPAFEEIGSSLEASVIDRFERGIGPDGRPWEKSQRAIEQGGQTLVDSSRLRTSIVSRASRSELEQGTNVIYGRIHQLGGEAGRNLTVRLPARPYLGVSDEDERSIERIIGNYLAEAV